MPPYAPLRLGAVRPAGWLRQQMLDDLRHGFAGHLDELTKHVDLAIFGAGQVRSFLLNPVGTLEDTKQQWWDGESTGVWLDGFVRLAYLSGDPVAVAKVDRCLAQLLAQQEESGYLGMYVPECRYRHTKDNGEFWTQSRALMALLAAYEFTGKTEFLTAVERALALTMREYGPRRSYFRNEAPAGGNGHGLMMVDVLAWVYRLTGKAEYRDYGIWCYRDYCTAASIRDVDNQLDNLLDLRKGFFWHTPHTVEHLRVPLWVAAVTGDARDRQAAANAFRKVDRYLTPAGACIGDESVLDRQPTGDIPYEYCAITELLTSWLSAGEITGNAGFGDRVEWLAFNAAQGARLPDGTGISYLTRDNRHTATATEIHGRLKLSPTHEDVAVCCNPAATKLLPYYVARQWLALADGTGVCAFCYGASTLRTTIAGVAVTIDEATAYPFAENVAFTITPAAPVEFELRLRIPGWATAYTVEAPSAEVRETDGFCRVRKCWQAGDRASIRFACAIAAVPTADGRFAVRRGPLLYALPIPAERRPLRDYTVPGFADFEAVPAAPVPDLRIDPDHLDLEVQHRSETDPVRPWHDSPIALVGAATLLPLGATLLRQATFARRKSR